ncbi:MAG: hypothetical protein GX190_03600 [Mollicutes bacterium]|nr:hypothetical protein [Mollicutes bacterium]
MGYTADAMVGLRNAIRKEFSEFKQAIKNFEKNFNVEEQINLLKRIEEHQNAIEEQLRYANMLTLLQIAIQYPENRLLTRKEEKQLLENVKKAIMENPNKELTENNLILKKKI